MAWAGAAVGALVGALTFRYGLRGSYFALVTLAFADERAGVWLAAYFKHDYILVFDGQDNPVYSLIGHHAADTAWFARARPELIELLDFVRGRAPTSKA